MSEYLRGMMKFNCPICNHECKTTVTGGRDYFILEGNSPDFGIEYCTSCEIAYSTPFLNDHELSVYYPDNYESYKPKKSFAAWLQTKKYQSDLRLILRDAKGAGRSLFEIGAGRAEFLNEAKKAGCKVSGIEPGKSGVEFARANYDISTVRQGYASGIAFTEKYDIIAARHVLEHINEFVSVLNSIKENGLAPGGLLFLKLPRMDSWEAGKFGKFWHGYDLPRHRVHFSRSGIGKLLKRIGYKNIVIKNEVVPTDIIRGFHCYRKHGDRGAKRTFATLFDVLPGPVKLILAQALGIIMSPCGAGRMIIIANK